MLTKLLTYKTSIVATLIVAISSVYVCQILCDLDIYSMNRACHTSICSSDDLPNSDHISQSLLIENHQHTTSSHDHHGDNDHHSSNSHDLPGDNHQHSTTSHQTNHEDDCCEDMTTKVFDSLFPQKTDLPSLEAKLFFVFEIEVPLYKIALNHISRDLFRYYSDSSPPTKGADIIILVQSFLL
jgi:hypothetical protein